GCPGGCPGRGRRYPLKDRGIRPQPPDADRRRTRRDSAPAFSPNKPNFPPTFAPDRPIYSLQLIMNQGIMDVIIAPQVAAEYAEVAAKFAPAGRSRRRPGGCPGRVLDAASGPRRSAPATRGGPPSEASEPTPAFSPNKPNSRPSVARNRTVFL